MKQAFVNYAHRGASSYYPENTLSAFAAGIRMGANGIETDVQLSRDGIPVLFHDNTLDRVTGQPGAVCDYTLAELQSFTVKSPDPAHPGDRIPTLEEFLQQFGGLPLTFAIELKQPGAEEKTLALFCR